MNREAARSNIRDACTVVLLRDAAQGPDVLMLRRSKNAVFHGGAYVFPGGALDDADRHPSAVARVRGLAETEANARLGLAGDALAYWFSAVRETFEESGLLLAVSDGPDPMPDERWREIAALRAEINAGSRRLADLLSRYSLMIPAGELIYFDHWITPPKRPRRFDTRFFIARAPVAQIASHDDAEMIDTRWLRPIDALTQAERSEIELAAPTKFTLQMLARMSSVDEALDAMRALREIPTRRPCIVQSAAGELTLRPGEAAYHEARWSDPEDTTLTSIDMTPGVVKRLDPWVSRLIAPNPGVMTGPGTNTYFVGTDDLLVIDPGPADGAHIEAILAHGAGRIRWIACTHTHLDHSPAAAAIAAATGAMTIGMKAPGERHDQTFAPRHIPEHGEVLQLGGITLTALHTPGHSSDHLCYLLHKTGMLFTGDHVMQGSSVVIRPPEGNMRQYLASLDMLLAREIAIMAPGHGYLIGDAHKELRGLIQHRQWREQRVLAALAARRAATAEELLDEVYPDIGHALKAPAARSLLAHLIKLAEDGVAVERQGRYALA
jgi:glyoxylase-like metal-dependent hydrolase (beta-lactamase superfamily II)/8-oxo-dGTP pyrophosphatase MutT (NUDIX family)